MSQGASGGIGLTQRCYRAAGGHEVRLRHQPSPFRNHRERHGSPNGTWTNIAGDGPGAYHHDDRLEDWFQNKVSDFSDHYPKAASGSTGRTSVEDFQENGWINAKEIEPDRWGTYPPL